MKFAGESCKSLPETPDALDKALAQAGSSQKPDILLKYLERAFRTITPKANDPGATSFLEQRDQIVAKIGRETIDKHFTPQIAETLIDMATLFPLAFATATHGNKAYAHKVKVLINRCLSNTSGSLWPFNTFGSRQFIHRHLDALMTGMQQFARAF
jgi:hypothetical protein